MFKEPSRICSRRHSNFFFFFSKKICFDFSCELSALHMKYQLIFCLADDSHEMSKAIFFFVKEFYDFFFKMLPL